MPSKLEEALLHQITLAQLPVPTRELVAIPGRRFRFDFAWPDYRLLVEVQGGTFSRGASGHSSGMGINRDCEKNNLAVLAGWRLLAFDTKQIKSGQALRWLQEALQVAA